MTDNVTCLDLLDGLSDYLDGAAPGELCAEIERHLAECHKCRVVVDTLRKTVTLYHQLPQLQMPAQVRERLYKRLDLAEYLPPVK
jgi:predicted anti-sigma-YlaC factor YlaD